MSDSPMVIPFRPRSAPAAPPESREVELAVRMRLTPAELAAARALRTNTERLLFVGSTLLKQTDAAARAQLAALLSAAESPLPQVAAQLALIEGVDAVLASFRLAEEAAAALAADGSEPHYGDLPQPETAL